ncbi:hypothetical protein [Stackebrandtia soli]|uniref:hypothetical protein n=1 Tax=Stackebrandtia soli TaxID=1892856 RepID=UPI0039ED21FC
MPPEPRRVEPDDPDEHRRRFEADIAAAKEVLDRVRMEMPFRKALWAYRLYYIGMLSCVGSLLVSCFDGSESPMVVVPVMLPLGVLGYLYGRFQLRHEFGPFLDGADPELWHARRDRKHMWQLAILRDSFMGRLH